MLTWDFEREFVVAHELAHLDMRHSQTVVKELAASSPGPPKDPGLVQLFYHVVSRGYDRAQEKAADEWAARQLAAMGRTAYKITKFIVGQQQLAGMKPVGEIVVDDVSSPIQHINMHWRRHPVPDERADWIRKTIDPLLGKKP